MDLHTLWVDCANREGFPLAGSVDLEAAFADSKNSIQAHIEHYDKWIEAGYAGSMEYLVRGRDRRADPRLVFPDAKSIFCVGIPYPRSPAGSLSAKDGPRYARYLQGQDYHEVIKEKLERVMQNVKALWSPGRSDTPELAWKICVDTSAILERSWAALAGLGWIGKNTLLIHPKEGSYLFLAEVLVNQTAWQNSRQRGGLASEKIPPPLPDYCGHCTRCIDACPTQALREPHLLDSNRCISYLTLEKRGDLNLDPATQSKMGAWIAGCDICQEVCPFNLKPSRLSAQPKDSHLNFNATTTATWKELLEESPESYKLRTKNSALKRVKPAQFSRNLAITLKNSLEKDPHTVESSCQSSRLPKDGNNWEPSPKSSIEPFIHHRAQTESDVSAQREWQKCIDLLTKT